MTARHWASGNYSYAPGVFQYSAGVKADPGYAIERVRLAEPVPWRAGFDLIRAFITGRGRPLTAFCACEMRSPEPFSEGGFVRFNEAYAQVLAEWGLLAGGDNPVARSNVCPAIDPSGEPAFHAFAFTVPAADPAPSFIVAGGAEAPEGKGNYADHIVARGDLSPEGLRAKVAYVVDEMTRRLAVLGEDWTQTSAVQVYTVHDIHAFVPDLLMRRGAARHGLTWHYARPPVVDLEYEMDCRSIAHEHFLR